MEFLRDTWVTLSTDSGSNYRLFVRNISFDQSYKQTSTKRKTLHDSAALIEGSEINEANPAQFEMELSLIDESSQFQHTPLQYLLKNTADSLDTFTLYIDPYAGTTSGNNKKYKLSKCVIESGSFSISKNQLMYVSLQGSARELDRVTQVVTHGTHPGSDSDNPKASAVLPKVLNVTVDGTLLEGVQGVSLEVQNNIEWTKNNTLQKSLVATSSTNTTYPDNFTLKDRVVAGNITTYVGTQISHLLNWKENITIRIQAGLSSSNYQFDANLTPCSFTNRVQSTEAYTQAYDFRMMGGSVDLNTLFTY